MQHNSTYSSINYQQQYIVKLYYIIFIFAYGRGGYMQGDAK